VSILPNLEKNAYLVLYIKDFYISASLIYSDFSISRYYILDSNLEHIRTDQLTNFLFWKEYFMNLEKYFSWEFIHKGTGNLMHFGGEGVGLRGIEVVIDNRYFKNITNDIVSAIRGYILDINIRFIDNNHIGEILDGVSNRLGYSDIMYLDLNLKDFNVYRYIKNTSGGILTSKRTKADINFGHIHNHSFTGLVDKIYDNSFKAFVSKNINNEVINTWANYVNNYGLFPTNNTIQDLLRSYILAQILTIRNDNPDKFDNFGVDKSKSLLIISGSLIYNIDYKSLLLSIIDGFELMGDIDIVFDKNDRLVPFSNNYINGNIQSNYIVGVSDMIDKTIKLLIPTKSVKNKDRKVISDITINTVTKENTKYFAFNNEITFINMPNEKYIMDMKLLNNYELFDKDIYSYVTTPDDLQYTQFIFDGRSRPVVYGPTDKENLVKISSWINEEGTEINS